jgi:hypothetical protein
MEPVICPQVPSSICGLIQGCTNPGRLHFVLWRLIFLGPSAWNFIRVAHLAPRMLRLLVNFWKIRARMV